MWMTGALIAGSFTALIGMVGLFMPIRAIRLINLDVNPDRPEGITEVRATLGGLFICAGLFTVFAQTPDAYGTLGAAWLGAAAIRSIFMLPDRSATSFNLISILVEVFVGFWLIMPWILQTFA